MESHSRLEVCCFAPTVTASRPHQLRSIAARGAALEPDAVLSSARAVNGPRSLASQIKSPIGGEMELGGDAILDRLRVVAVFVVWRGFLIRGEFPAGDYLAFAQLHGLEDGVVCHDVGPRLHVGGGGVDPVSGAAPRG